VATATTGGAQTRYHCDNIWPIAKRSNRQGSILPVNARCRMRGCCENSTPCRRWPFDTAQHYRRKHLRQSICQKLRLLTLRNLRHGSRL
jgi:hypothetical protein